MSEMVERVAKAICAQDRGPDLWDVILDGHTDHRDSGWFKGDYRDLARAAIKAMSEPTKSMIAAGALITDSYPDAEGCYSWMIDEALKERE